MYTIVIIAASVLGLAVGSFLNVVVYRVPAGKSVVRPPSACPSCGTEIRPRDNIPVLSWLLLRGHCRDCGATISARYPAIEALTALVFGLVAARFGASWSLPAELAFVGALVALAAIDLERYLLPRAVVYPASILVGGGLVIAAIAKGQWHRLGVAVACAAVTFAVFFAINFVRPAWMGFGDVRLSALIGLALGWLGAWTVVVGFMAANLLGAMTGVVLIARGRAGRRTALPYGVFLAAGSVFAVLAAAPIIHWYSSHLGR